MASGQDSDLDSPLQATQPVPPPPPPTPQPSPAPNIADQITIGPPLLKRTRRTGPERSYTPPPRAPRGVRMGRDVPHNSPYSVVYRSKWGEVSSQGDINDAPPDARAAIYAELKAGLNPAEKLKGTYWQLTVAPTARLEGVTGAVMFNVYDEDGITTWRYEKKGPTANGLPAEPPHGQGYTLSLVETYD